MALKFRSVTNFTHLPFQLKISIHFTSMNVSMYASKSFSETLILASVNPQYDMKLLIELHTTFCVQILFLKSKQKQKKTFLYTTCCELIFFGEFNEQSLVILLIN